MNYLKTEEKIVSEIASTLRLISEKQVEELIMEIKSAKRVFFVGVGRVLLSLQSIAKRLAHLGVETIIVGQITEPAITSEDLLIVGSGSGESLFPLSIAKKAKSFSARVVHIGSNPDSSMKSIADLFVRIPVKSKLSLSDEVASVQPMTSLFEQCLLLLGDTIALMMIEEAQIDMPSLWQYHANLE
ncbi:MAG: 6-phospho-3-hexuloisomerase [Enterococcus casseliflavus]|nr:6-phospho-3-hexuloisomerase [Enterococcus casseliflavus]